MALADKDVLRRMRRPQTVRDYGELAEVRTRRIEKHLGLAVVLPDEELLEIYRDLEREAQANKCEACNKESGAASKEPAQWSVGSRFIRKTTKVLNVKATALNFLSLFLRHGNGKGKDTSSNKVKH